MPKEDLVRMTCGWCANTDTFNIRDKAEIILPIIKRWYGVMRGDEPPAQGADSHEWYDSLDCLIAGVKRKERLEKEFAADQAKMDAALDKADKELKASPYMVKN